MARHVRFAAVSLSSRVALAAVLSAAACAPPALAQHRQLASNDPQALMLGYYAASLSFTPVGLPHPGFAVGGALGYIPSLSVEDRTVGFGGTKTEDTNRCPAFPRLTGSWGSRRGFAVEAGYTPPLEACGLKANVIALAGSYRFPLAPSWDGLARLSFLTGSIKGDITCSAASVANPADRTCYGGAPSNDEISPGGYGLDFAFAHRGSPESRFEPYAILGFNRETVDLQVNYTRTTPNTGSLPALDDHQLMTAKLTRVHAGAGAGWRLVRWLTVAGELYYEPGAVLTARGSARATFGGAP
jgi:hypothetical protein